MTEPWKPKGPPGRKLPWRDFLTAEEREILAKADAAREEWQRLTYERACNTNRSIQRANSAALGYSEPSAREKRMVRGAVAALAERAEGRPGSISLRSLSRTPNRVESGRPSELGVSGRSRFLPRVNGTPSAGYPVAQRPLAGVADAPPMRLPSYSWSEVQRHASGESVWIVIDGDVYDVTGWLAEHPGGAERLLAWAGKDASAAFHEAKHGPLTQVLRLNYRVGRVSGIDPAAS